jgi:membrane-bound serine protease (ClpP class)
MGGTATALEIVLFLAGVICLGVEILLIPGFGVFGVTGILLIVFSIILASQTFVIPQSPSQWREFTFSMLPLFAAFGSLIGFAYLIAKYLPHVPILGRMILQPNFPQGDELSSLPPSPYESLLGSSGVAMTMLRPAGLVRFGDQYIDVVTEGSYIDEGARVEVIEVTGNRIVVKQVSCQTR